jgi:hypothetical protein
MKVKEPFLINPPLGDQLLLVGPNPRKKEVLKMPKRMRRLSRFGLMSPKRVRRRKNPIEGFALMNPRRRNPLEEFALINPRRRRRTRYRRRNPLEEFALMNPRRQPRVKRSRSAAGKFSSPFGSIDVRKPQTLLIPIGVGLASKFAVTRIPRMVNVAPGSFGSIAMKLGLALGGAILLRRALGDTNALIWAVVGGSEAVSEFVDKVTGQIAGLGYEPQEISAYPGEEVQGIEAYPGEEVQGIEAYPGEEIQGIEYTTPESYESLEEEEMAEVY